MATLKMVIPVIFFLIAATIACGADSTETPPVSPTPPLPRSSEHYFHFQKFENPLYGYSIDIPIGWLPSEVTAPGQEVVFASPGRSVLGFVRVTNQPIPSLNDGMDAWLELTETRPHKSFQVLNRSDATDMGEYDETSVVYYLDRERANCPREHFDYLRTGLGRTYFLGLSVCLDDAEQSSETLDSIYSSFDIRTPPVSPTTSLPRSSGHYFHFQKFENPLYGYSIDIPIGWLPSEVTAPGQKVAFASPGRSVLGSVRVANQPIPSLNDGMDEWLGLTETRPHKAFQVLNRSDVTDMGEYDETSVMYYLDREEDHCPREHFDYLRTGLGRTYFLALSVCTDDAEQYTDTLDYIYFSFDTR